MGRLKQTRGAEHVILLILNAYNSTDLTIPTLLLGKEQLVWKS